jgi:competence protein CoiA
MVSAKRTNSNNADAPGWRMKPGVGFLCPACGRAVISRKSRIGKDGSFQKRRCICTYAGGETEAHRHCKMEIFKALQKQPGVHNPMLERPLGTNRPDVSVEINGVPVAIEVQISSLLRETIQRRTIEYARKGIYVLWLLRWTPKLDGRSYSPALWEKWIHAAYFGRVYYWIEGLTVVSYHFDTNHRTVPKKSWHAENGKKMTAGGYSRRSKRYRTAVRGKTFNIATDFALRERFWWEGNGLKVPDAKLFMDRQQRFIPHEEIGSD